MDGPPTSEFAAVEEEFPLADAIINNADSLGICIVLDCHCPRYNTGKGEWDVPNFWTTYAPRYKDRPFVMSELLTCRKKKSHGLVDQAKLASWKNGFSFV